MSDFPDQEAELTNGDIGARCDCGRLFQPDSEGGMDKGLLICGQCLHDLIQQQEREHYGDNE